MRESSSASAARVNRVALIVLRVAAYLIVATGFNEIVSAAAPRYEPLYIYVALAAIVTLFDGVIFGFPAGLVGIAIYLVLYTPRPIRLESVSWGGQILFGALLAATFSRLIWQLRHHEAAADAEDEEPAGMGRPLIEASVISSSDEVVSAIELLRSELRFAVEDVSASRDRERELQAELRETRAKLAESRDVEHALRVSAAGEAERIVAGAQAALDQLNARLAQVEENARVREQRLEEAYRAARDGAAARAEQLERENTAFREARRESEAREAALREQIESLHADVESAKLQLEAAAAERASLAERLALETQRATQALSAAEGLRAGLDRAQSDLSALRRDEETLRSATEAAGEAVRRADEMVQNLRAELASARADLERERAARAGVDEHFDIARRELEAEIRRLTTEVADRTAQRDAAREIHESNASLLAKYQSDVEALMTVAEQERVARAAADEAAASAESELIDAREAAEEAAGQLASARVALAQAENEAADARAARERLAGELTDAAGAFEKAAAELDELRAAAGISAAELDEARAAASAAARELEEVRAAAAALEQEVAALRSEAEHVAAAAEPAVVADLTAELEMVRARYAEAAKRISDLTTHNETLVAEVKQSREALAAEVRDRDTVVRQLTLRVETAEGAMRIDRATAQTATDETQSLRQERDALARQLENAVAERDAYAHDLRSRRDDAAEGSEAAAQLASLRESHEQAARALEAVTAERDQLLGRVASADAAAERLSISVAEERGLRVAAEVALEEGRAAMKQIVTDATHTQRDLADLRGTHEQALTAIEQLRRNLDASREHMESSHVRIAELEDALREALASDEATSDAAMLRQDLASAQASIASLGQARTETESRLAAAIAERESVYERLELLQQQNDQLRSEAVTAQLEFDRKLQEIVIHLAEDHEADVGQAVMEREEARAEVRQLTARLTALSEQFESERVRWIETRDAMVRRLKQIQSRPAGPGEAAPERPPVATDQPFETSPQRPAVSASLLIEPEEPPVAPRAPLILVAHPDVQLREAARTRLEDVGYRVTTAADGLEGLRRAMAEQPDVVIADSSMPKMDGRELCQMLKSQEKTARIKVVLLARSTAEVASEPGLKPDEILRKPVRFELLRSSIASLLAHHPS